MGLSRPLIPSYMQNNEALNVLLPIGALHFIHTLESLSRGKFVLLAADKAHSHEEDLRLTKENPHVAIHGSFSMMANFHALRQYFSDNRGTSFHTPYYTGLQVGAFVMGDVPLWEFQFAWEVEAMERWDIECAGGVRPRQFFAAAAMHPRRDAVAVSEEHPGADPTESVRERGVLQVQAGAGGPHSLRERSAADRLQERHHAHRRELLSAVGVQGGAAQQR